MNWSADTLSATTKNPLPLGMGSVKEYYRSAFHIIPASEMCKSILEVGEMTKEDIANIRKMLDSF